MICGMCVSVCVYVCFAHEVGVCFVLRFLRGLFLTYLVTRNTHNIFSTSEIPSSPCFSARYHGIPNLPMSVSVMECCYGNRNYGTYGEYTGFKMCVSLVYQKTFAMFSSYSLHSLLNFEHSQIDYNVPYFSWIKSI